MALGSNLGNRLNYLEQARFKLALIFGKAILCSPIYDTPAWGKTDQNSFLNQVLSFEPRQDYSDIEVLKIILEIEDHMGRRRFEKWGPRIIDIDLLYMGNQKTENKVLKIPHPEISRRRFVLQPLSDILPDFIDPANGLSVSEMLANCTDHSPIEKISH